MCILINHTKDTSFDYNDLIDFRAYNPDGIGVMWLEDGVVRVEKALPKSDAEVWEFYEKYVQGKDCALHLRLKTHGAIDSENCHPYAIPDTNTWLMHNGILATGNAKDKTKSDTWHYARDYLQPLLTTHPTLHLQPAFQEMIGAHIGTGNRFIVMSPEGTAIINKHHGVEYKGAWMSNTYAWSAPITPRYKATYPTVANSWNKHWFDDELWEPVGEKEPDYSADYAVEYFFECLDNAALWDAYNKITYAEVEKCYASLGEDKFYEMCDLIFDLNLKDTDVVWCIQNPSEVFEAERMAA